MDADPVMVNGERRTLPEFVAMASGTRVVVTDTRREPVEVVRTPGQVAVAFRLRDGTRARSPRRLEPSRRRAARRI
jgi:hypothetical protein